VNNSKGESITNQASLQHRQYPAGSMAEGGHAGDQEEGVHGKVSAETAMPGDVLVEAIVEWVLERLGREGVQPITPMASGEGSSSSVGATGGE